VAGDAPPRSGRWAARTAQARLDEERFLGPHGIRSVSRWHLEHPYTVNVAGGEYSVQYEPAESTTGMFGGNSNAREARGVTEPQLPLPGQPRR
jgi:hypothetical protein